MASVGTQEYDGEIQYESWHKLTPLNRPKSSSNRLPSARVSPVWQLEIKNANFGYGRQSLQCMVPYAYSSETSQSSAPITPSPPRNPSRPLHDPLENTLFFHRLSLNRRPSKPIRLPLKTKIEDQRPYTSSNSYPTVRPIYRTSRAMTSSLIDQIPLPSATGEPPEVGIRRPSSVSPKRSSDISRSALITNSFMWPSSAKVPFPPHLDKKNQIPQHVGATSTSWHNGEEVDFSQPSGGVSKHAYSSIEASSNGQGTANTDATADQIRASVPYRGIQLTEAVRRLAERHLDPSPQQVCQNDQSFASCEELLQPSFHPKPFNNMAPCSWTASDHGLNGDQGTHFTNHVCHESVPDFNSIRNDSCNLGASSQSNETTDTASEPQLPDNGGSAQPMNITIMASQISTIHLNRACANETGGDRPDSAASDQELLASSCEQDCVEEELPEGLDDSQEEEDDDEEDPEDPSIIRTSLALSLSSSRQLDQTEQTPSVTKPALTPSLFPNLPPTIYFGTHDEKVELLPWAQRKLLKWKMSTVTPIVVKQAVARSHFRVTKKNHDWLGCWGHHMKSVAFKTIREYQKLNHFPGSFQIGRKDRLWRNLSKMQARHGRKEFNFFPQSFVLPQDIKLLKKAWEQGGNRQKWIVKPPASARGMGIQVIHRWSQLPKKRPLLVQRYLHKPYLISGSKFDLRIYVYVPSYDPLRVYLFNDGLVRFASCKYSSSMKTLSNKFMHLTNYSVNKKNADYMANADETACQGHKWALRALWTYLDQKGFSSEKIWEKIKEMVIKTIIASEPYVNSLVKMYVQNPYSCHELFGFDIMLDENLKPWVLEVNISPSLHSNSPLDVSIKGQMVRDLLNLAGFLLPSKADMSSSNAASSSSITSARRERGRSLEVLNEEKAKRSLYLGQKLPDKELNATVLDKLTPEDVRVLMETEDELSRCGQFERVFPSPISSRYLRFFEQQRYFNILTNQWEQKYYNDREAGRDLLRSLSMKNDHTGSVHVPRSPLKTPALSTAHLNGFNQEDTPSPSKLPVSPEAKLRSPCKMPSFPQQPELPERPLLSQSLSNVPEPTLVM